MLDGRMLASTGSHGSGVDFLVRVISLRQLFIVVSTFFTWVLCDQTGQQYSAVEYTNDKADDPHDDPASFWIILRSDGSK